MYLYIYNELYIYDGIILPNLALNIVLPLAIEPLGLS